MSHLRCEGITVSFGGVLANDSITLDVPEGKIVGLIGPNGAGKTTLFNVLSRFQEHEAGHIYYKGERIDQKQPHQMAELGLARTFQNINLFSEQSMLDNILIGAHGQMGWPFSSLLGLPAARKREQNMQKRAYEIAELLQIENYLDFKVSNLPYGFQKRVELARGLASNPNSYRCDLVSTMSIRYLSPE